MTRVKFLQEISNFPLYVHVFSHLPINKEGVCAGSCVIIQKFVMKRHSKLYEDGWRGSSWGASSRAELKLIQSPYASAMPYTLLLLGKHKGNPIYSSTKENFVFVTPLVENKSKKGQFYKKISKTLTTSFVLFFQVYYDVNWSEAKMKEQGGGILIPRCKGIRVNGTRCNGMNVAQDINYWN